MQHTHTTIGQAIFNPKIQQLFQSPPEKVSSTLCSDEWQINLYQFQRYSWPKIFDLMQKVTCQKIYAKSNSYFLILKSISRPEYKNLRVLDLSGNKIKNIEALSFINMPNIESFHLSKNQITILKPLQKIRWQRLNLLFLQNVISSECSLNRFKSSPILTISLDTQSSLYQTYILRSTNNLMQQQPNYQRIALQNLIIKNQILFLVINKFIKRKFQVFFQKRTAEVVLKTLID